MDRPVVNETLCFICQEIPPTFVLNTNSGEFKVCKECADLTETEIHRQNRIRSALMNGRGGNILRMTLGINPLPLKVTRTSIVPKI